jgi:hypothetical protein
MNIAKVDIPMPGMVGVLMYGVRYFEGLGWSPPERGSRYRTAILKTFDACVGSMGDARDDMASNYRPKIGDDRLEAVAEHVRAWLFPPAESEVQSCKPR